MEKLLEKRIGLEGGNTEGDKGDGTWWGLVMWEWDPGKGFRWEEARSPDEQLFEAN